VLRAGIEVRKEKEPFILELRLLLYFIFRLIDWKENLGRKT
jgi:hypothetical protein